MFTDLLIVGAGPYGLGLAAYAAQHQIDYLAVGKPMDFWKANMPAGMYLRSGTDWHLDPNDTYTIDRYLEEHHLTATEVYPLSLEFYLSYTDWFQEKIAFKHKSGLISRLDEQSGGFRATLQDGSSIDARNVMIALGFGYFKHIPPEIETLLPPGRFSHTCDFVDLESVRSKRCLIIGGRQSAFEWTALMHEHGAAAIHVVHRHPSPAFQEADWTWVSPLVDAMVTNPGWFRRLSDAEKDGVRQRLWAEGRLKVEPWLEQRCNNDTIKVWSKTSLAACTVLPSGELHVTLDNGEVLAIDYTVLATGYKPNIYKVPFLAQSNILSKLAVKSDFPVLDECFQSSIEGLFFTSFLATQDFGPFFSFTVAVRAAALIAGRCIRNRLAEAQRS